MVEHLGVLIYVRDTPEAYAIVSRLLDAVSSGRYLVIAHRTSEVYGAATEDVVRHRNEFVDPPMTLRSGAEIAGFFDGLRLLEPGVVSVTRWRPAGDDLADPREVDEFGGVGERA